MSTDQLLFTQSISHLSSKSLNNFMSHLASQLAKHRVIILLTFQLT